MGRRAGRWEGGRASRSARRGSCVGGTSRASRSAAEDPDGFGHEEYGYEDEEGANGGLGEQAELEQGPEGLQEAETEAEGEGAPKAQEATSAGTKGKGKGTGGSIFGGGRGDAGKRDAQRRRLEKLRQLLPPGLDRNAAEAVSAYTPSWPNQLRSPRPDGAAAPPPKLKARAGGESRAYWRGQRKAGGRPATPKAKFHAHRRAIGEQCRRYDAGPVPRQSVGFVPERQLRGILAMEGVRVTAREFANVVAQFGGEQSGLVDYQELLREVGTWGGGGGGVAESRAEAE